MICLGIFFFHLLLVPKQEAAVGEGAGVRKERLYSEHLLYHGFSVKTLVKSLQHETLQQGGHKWLSLGCIVYPSKQASLRRGQPNATWQLKFIPVEARGSKPTLENDYLRGPE